MQYKEYRILIINPGSTSTKIGVFDNELSIFEKTIRHVAESINSFRKIIDQSEYRKDIIRKLLIKRKSISLSYPRYVDVVGCFDR